MKPVASQQGRAVGAPVGPGSLLWSIAGDPRSLLTGTAAGIMQLMLPSLGAGVTDHSDFFDDPYDRIFRSVPRIWASIFAADDAEGDAVGRSIRDFHPDIKGIDHHGNRYHALDPETYWWAHATFTWEFFRARELYYPVPLGRQDRERLYAETVTWYRRYGVSDRVVPPTYRDFTERFDEICRNELELTPAIQWVLDPRQNTSSQSVPVRLPGPLGLLNGPATNLRTDLLRIMVYGNMPDVVRRRFGFAWSNSDRATFLALCATIRSLHPAFGHGLLADIWPEGTPHLDPGDNTEVVIAPPNPKMRSRRSSQAD